MTKAVFLPGVTELTVNGLYQWDYGQQLEIECADLPALAEVHFACKGMPEAVVRLCNVENGVLRATIPDRCLEQAFPIYAWVVLVDATSGTTVLKVTMPVTARARPAARESVPEDIGDQYTESLATINGLIESLKAGNVEVSKAHNATSAGYANLANRATTAAKADEATIASSVTAECASTILDRAAVPVLTYPAGIEYDKTLGGFVVLTPGVYMAVYRYTNGGLIETFSAIIMVYNMAMNARSAEIRVANGLSCSLCYDDFMNSQGQKVLYLLGTADVVDAQGGTFTPGACYKLAEL